jgi:hypothetical protein
MVTQAPISGEDEKLIPTMIYTLQRLIWGQLIVKEIVRVSTLLQTGLAPKYMDLANAQVILFGAGGETRTLQFQKLLVENDQIIAYHLLPPADESPYYEDNEPNRKMEPVTALSGIFRFDGFMRMAQQSDIKTYLGVQKGNFIPLFDVSMTCPLIPSIKGIRSPFILIRQGRTIFSS